MTYNFTADGIKPQQATLEDFEATLTKHSVEFVCFPSRRNPSIIIYNFELNGQQVAVMAYPIS